MVNKRNLEETSDSEYIQNGGENTSEKHFPTGGFPPIFINILKDKKNDTKYNFVNQKKREKNVSINDILNKNYKTRSFI
tara:strand:+ start:195 stop:431 length:237 start_codon:yes stop_codon:yes gene_type:complete